MSTGADTARLAPLFEVRGPMADPKGPNTLGGVARLYFGHASSKIILASLLPLVGARVWLGAWRPWDAGIVAIAVVVWPFFEWVFHWAIHLRPLRVFGVTLDTLAAREHRAHHVDPTLIDHTLLPPPALVGMALASIGGFWWLLGARLGVTAAICFHLGGLANGWVHLLSHTRYSPKSRFFRWVRRTHTLHHFKNERYWLAFTGPFVDVVCGTHLDPADVETSAACAARGARGRTEWAESPSDGDGDATGSSGAEGPDGTGRSSGEAP